MKKISLIYLLIFSTLLCNAQSYNWIKGGGSTEGMSPSSQYEHVKNMCTDANGNIYITAQVGATNILADTFSMLLAHNHASSQNHIFLASYSCEGTLRWAKLIESSNDSYCGNNDNFTNNGLTYCNGSIYIVGAFYGYTKWIGYDTTFSNNQSSFIARFDTSGGLKWIRFVGPDSASTFAATGDPGVVAIDGQNYIHNFNAMKGDVHLIPLSFITDTTSFYLTYDLKYDSSGNLISVNRVHFDSLWFISKAVFDKNNNKYYTLLQPNATYWSTYYSASNSAVSAFRPDGTQLWMDTTGQSGTLTGLDYKGNNAIYVSGVGGFPDTFSLGGLTVTDTLFPYYYAFATIFKMDTNGIGHWVYNLQSNTGIYFFDDISILPNGNISAIGGGGSTAIHGTDTLKTIATEYSNPILLVINNSGHTVKLDQWHGNGYDYGFSITSDNIGNIYVGGEVADSLNATGIGAYHSHGGNTDFFIAKYGYNCACTAMPASNFTRTGSPVASFTYTGSTTMLDSVVWHFGDGGHATGTTATHTYTVSGFFYPCVTVYTECGSDTYCDTITVTLPTTGIFTKTTMPISIYPNPTTNELIIESAEVGATFNISNMLGQSMYRGSVTTVMQSVDIRRLAPGVYIINMTDRNGYGLKATIIKQ